MSGSTKRQPIIAGNWKMNTSLDEACALASALATSLAPFEQVERVLIPPFPWIVPLSEIVGESALELGGQDCAVEDQGAFTGEVSAAMLAPLCRYVIVGHSERRHILGETDVIVAAKLRAALRNDLHPILCVGELLEERGRGMDRAVVERQLLSALSEVSEEQAERLVVAYEPVWAIGTGQAATADDARDMANWIRELLRRRFSPAVSVATRIQYGGSVNAENAASFLGLDEVDGALVGGASLNADAFTRIVAATSPRL